MKTFTVSSAVLLAFTVTSLLSLSSEAVISNPANFTDVNTGSICRILIFNEGTNSICTGSLVKSNLVLTANHCAVDSKARIEVGCGYQGYDPQNIVTIKTGKGNAVIQNVSFKEMAFGQFSSTDSQNDQALIQLDRNLSIPPMKFNNGEVDLTRPCLLAGYGINKTGTAGILLSAWVLNTQEAETAYRFDNIFESTLASDGYLPRIDDMARSSIESTMQGASLLAGDSGGPFLCYNKQGELTQVAVSNSIHRSNQMNSGRLYFMVASFAIKLSSALRSSFQF
jgi:secreted trypsin-like serine protease